MDKRFRINNEFCEFYGILIGDGCISRYMNQNNTQFRIALNALGIKHYVAKVNRPQTNGKVERFFLTYKKEFATKSFTTVKDYVRHYNEERPHMSLNFKTPQQVWKELKSV